LRGKKQILRKVEAISNNALMSPAIYRLLTYVDWELVPEKYKSFYPEEAKDLWDSDLETFKDDNVLLDLDTEIKAVFRALNNKLIIQALAFVPIVLADFYILGNPMDPYETRVKKLTDRFIKNTIELEKHYADYLAMLDIADLLEDIIEKGNLEIKEDLPTILINLFSIYEEDIKKAEAYKEVEVELDERINSDTETSERDPDEPKTSV